MSPTRMFTWLVMKCIQLFDHPILKTGGVVYRTDAARPSPRLGDILLWRGQAVGTGSFRARGECRPGGAFAWRHCGKPFPPSSESDGRRAEYISSQAR